MTVFSDSQSDKIIKKKMKFPLKIVSMIEAELYEYCKTNPHVAVYQLPKLAMLF